MQHRALFQAEEPVGRRLQQAGGLSGKQLPRYVICGFVQVSPEPMRVKMMEEREAEVDDVDLAGVRSSVVVASVCQDIF